MAGPYELQSPKDIAMEYGGNKQKIAQAAQMGMIDPTAAVLAGMFIDKMRTAQQEEMAPQTTVAQEVMAAPQMAAGLGATPQAAMAPQMAPTEAGVAALPVPDEMVPNEFAGGGIVAFANGGGVALSDVLRTLTMDEARIYQSTGRLPARAQAMLSGQTAMPAAPMPGMGKAGTGPATISLGGPDVPQTPLPSGMSFYPGTAGLIQAPSATRTLPSNIEAIIAQAERGEGPNVSRSGAITRVPKGLKAEDTPFASAPVAQAPAAAATAQTDPLSGLAEYQAMLRAAGVPEDPFAEDREAMKTRQAELAARGKEDKAMALIGAGLAGMNTRNLAEFAEKAGGIGIGMLGQSKKEAREEQREIDKINRDTRKAELALKRGDVEKYMDFKDKAEARRIQMMGVQAQQAAAGRLGSQAEVISMYAKSKGIPFDQAVREVSAAQAEGKDPFLAKVMGGSSGINTQLADLMKKYPDAFK
jgi:hypothetical protein